MWCFSLDWMWFWLDGGFFGFQWIRIIDIVKVNRGGRFWNLTWLKRYKVLLNREIMGLHLTYLIKPNNYKQKCRLGKAAFVKIFFSWFKVSFYKIFIVQWLFSWIGYGSLSDVGFFWLLVDIDNWYCKSIPERPVLQSNLTESV